VPHLQGDERDPTVLWIHGADGEEELTVAEVKGKADVK
jgi:hypothetical protein